MVHSYIGPGVLLSHGLLTGARWSAFLALAWAFHIAADRLLGYGLKLTTGFQHTHLGVLRSGVPYMTNPVGDPAAESEQANSIELLAATAD
jgi:hypothetical protein